MAKLSYRRLTSTGLMCVLALALGTSPVLGAGKATEKTKGQKISLLYALNAGSGTLTQKKSGGERYKLVLKGLDRDVTWFSDRPARKSGSFPVTGLADSWQGFGFAADPPNAALTYTDPSGDPGRTVIVELSDPRYAKGRLSFAARVLDPGTIKEPNLADHARTADRRPPARLAHPSLFIDDTASKTAVDCVLQPYTSCEGVVLGPLNLWGADLRGANFSGSNLDGSHLPNTDLDGAVLVGTSLRNSEIEGQLVEANFNRADLTGSSLRGSELRGAHLESANLTEADLAGANLEQTWLLGADLRGADLEGIRTGGGAQWLNVNFTGANLRHATLMGVALAWADFEGADLTGAVLLGASGGQINFCNAKMPDGTIGPCNGPVGYLP